MFDGWKRYICRWFSMPPSYHRRSCLQTFIRWSISFCECCAFVPIPMAVLCPSHFPSRSFTFAVACMRCARAFMHPKHLWKRLSGFRNKWNIDESDVTNLKAIEYLINFIQNRQQQQQPRCATFRSCCCSCCGCYYFGLLLFMFMYTLIFVSRASFYLSILICSSKYAGMGDEWGEGGCARARVPF